MSNENEGFVIQERGPWTAEQRKKFRRDTVMVIRFFRRHMPLSDGEDRVLDLFRDAIYEHNWIGDDVI